MRRSWSLAPDRLFGVEPARRALARRLYEAVQELPIVSPHGHVPPTLLADPQAHFGSPAELLITPDHYVVRMLYSQGVPLEDLGLAARDAAPVEVVQRAIWQRFAERFYLFRATPTGLWLADLLVNLFGVEEKLTGESAMRIYDHLAVRLATPAFTPRALYRRFAIETLCTTDAADDPLEHHRHLRAEGFDVRPTFRPDALLNLDTPGWRGHLERLGERAGIDISGYPAFVRALEVRRAAFKALGAVATDHAVATPYTERLSPHEAGLIFTRALAGQVSEADVRRFGGHMLIEMARMSSEDWLVMQLHAGSYRNHNAPLYERFGPDIGADIPLATEWTRNLRPLLNACGNDMRLRLILFTLDEATYSRELAPLAGHYPALLLGPPWWFFDSVNGMRHYFELVVETAGLYNTAGFNDDTRAFCSIPARHDVWRRVSCDWLAGLALEGRIDEEEALEMAHDCAYGLAKRAYRLG